MIKQSCILGENLVDKRKYLNSLAYDILLRERKGKFYLYIQELSLVGVGENSEQAYEDLCKKKQDFFDKILDCQAEDEIIFPRKSRRVSQSFEQLRMFIVKMTIVCLLLGVTFIFGAATIKNQLASISGADIARKVSRDIVLEAKKFTNISDEHKQMRLEKFREFLVAFRPWINEVRDAFPPESYKENKSRR